MKYALIIGNDQYIDEKLPQLITPVEDARELAKVLGDKTIGEFNEVEQVVNKTTSEIRKTISKFLRNKQHDDLVLLYFSGHGVLDSQGRLHLASKDTETGYLAATAISASFVKDELSQCRSQRQIFILDCCHSGAVEHGVKAAITEETFEGGYGRVILTASTETQLALEGNKVLNHTEYSLFTHFLLEGLKTGDADKDNDGIISLDEWYSYAYTEVVSRTHKQTPQILGKRQGELFIAKNLNYKKKLSADLLQLIKHKLPSARIAAVEELSNLLQDADMAELVQASLEKLKKDNDAKVSAEAEIVLNRYKASFLPESRVDSPKTVNQNISDWLRSLDEDITAQSVDDPKNKDQNLPDWLRESEVSEKTNQKQDDAATWLESLADKQITKTKNKDHSIPDWLRGLDADIGTQPVDNVRNEPSAQKPTIMPKHKESETAQKTDQVKKAIPSSNNDEHITASSNKIVSNKKKEGWVEFGVVGSQETSMYAVPISYEINPLPDNHPPNKITLSNGMEFMRVQAGGFLMGSSAPYSNDAEKPEHIVDIPYDYWMARYPVTNELYNLYVKSRGIKHPVADWEKKKKHPVTYVKCTDVIEYCQWLNSLIKTELPSGSVLRLPTEAEWEKAARGTDGRDFPWGNKFDSNNCNVAVGFSGMFRITYAGTPVTKYSPQGDSPYGCADMGGNVWEWTHSLWKAYPYILKDGREDEKASGAHVLRGGAFNLTLWNARCSYRKYENIAKFSNDVGFRVCLSPLLQK